MFLFTYARFSCKHDNLWNPSWERLVQTAKKVSDSLNKGLWYQSDTEVHPWEANAAVSGADTVGLSVGLWIFIAVNCTAVYRNTVSWQCGRDSWPRNVLKVGYAVTLRACSVRCRYLAVTSKGWYGCGRSKCGRAAWHITTVRLSALLFTPDASVLKSSVNL